MAQLPQLLLMRAFIEKLRLSQCLYESGGRNNSKKFSCSTSRNSMLSTFILCITLSPCTLSLCCCTSHSQEGILNHLISVSFILIERLFTLIAFRCTFPFPSDRTFFFLKKALKLDTAELLNRSSRQGLLIAKTYTPSPFKFEFFNFTHSLRRTSGEGHQPFHHG